MFQTFDVTARPGQGPPRLAMLRDEVAQAGLDGFLVPRADAHQGEYVAARDARLGWLTGFTGSAGFCAVLHDVAGVFIDGRYRTQVKAQVADVFTPVPWPDVSLANWLKAQLPDGGQVGYDPWLHTVGQIEQTEAALNGSGIALVQSDNLVDRIWADQPAPPMRPVKPHPLQFAGEPSADKCARLARGLREAGHRAAVITQPDSIMWLLNIRGGDIARNPVAHGFAVLHDDERVDLFMAPQKVGGHLDGAVTLHDPGGFVGYLGRLDGPVRIDRSTVPQKLADALGKQAVFGDDPCALPKARKNAAEIEGAAQAHLRDGAAVVALLAWLDAQPPGSVTETDVVIRLEANRRRDTALQDISFDTISGTGPNGAIMHYRVSDETDARLEAGHLLVLDSGGQYRDGTTDITRTVPIGPIGPAGRDQCMAYTRVLQGLIAMSRLRWPVGLAGCHIEAVGRVPLWLAGQDFNHGLGHGVGAYLSVHEGPQRLSRASQVPLEPGMILSNEPGYYREGAFGIRLENLIVVQQAAKLAGGDDDRPMLDWRTLTFVPFDRRLIVPDMLSHPERGWLNAYHREVAEKIGPRLGKAEKLWLDAATAPIQ